MKRYLTPLVLVGVAAITALIFRAELTAWFRPSGHATAGSPHAGHTAAPPSTPAPPPIVEPALPPIELPAVALDALRAAFDASERVRGELALDRHDGVAAPARELAQALGVARAAVATASPAIAASVAEAQRAAATLAGSIDLATARAAFGALDRQLVALAAADPRLQDGWHVFACPMADGFQKWFQKSPTLSNPYMGQAMATCGSTSSWGAPPEAAAAPQDAAEATSHAGHDHAGDDTAYFTCSMHPSVRQDGPGQCPICAMDLTPVTFDQVESGVIFIDEARRGAVGIRTGSVVRAPLTRTLRAIGRVAYDESRLRDVTLKVDGWITRLHVNKTGQPVKQGQLLFTLYSPALFAAQQEYLLARASQVTGGAGARGEALVRAAGKKLRLWGLSQAQLDAIGARGEPLEDLPFYAPASGYVIEKDVVEGAMVTAGARLFRIAALDKVWIEAEVYEADLPQITVGQRATIALGSLPDRELAGTVAYIYPYLDAGTRTARLRIELPNPGLDLKPDMYATVSLPLDLGPRLQVPVDAVVYTGPRRLVFVDLGGGRLRPQEVTLGVRTDDAVEILSGLQEGATVVTSGNFLVAAESRIRSAAKFWTEERAGATP